jgi:hypothetical protein
MTQTWKILAKGKASATHRNDNTSRHNGDVDTVPGRYRAKGRRCNAPNDNTVAAIEKPQIRWGTLIQHFHSDITFDAVLDVLSSLESNAKWGTHFG